MKLLAVHRLLLAALAGALAVYTVGHLIMVRPLSREVSKLHNDLQKQRFHLNRSSLPLDAKRLEGLEAELAVSAKFAERRYREVVSRSASVFDKKILTFYETPRHFQAQASRLDYQEEFLRIEQALQQHGIVFDKAVLNLAEDSVDPETYKLILRLWSLEVVMQRVLAEQLLPAAAPGKPAAAVTVAAARPFYLNEQDASPYLLVLPVRLRLEGSIHSLHSFLSNAANLKNFCAVTHFEVRKQLPSAAGADQVVADLECCLFYLLTTELPAALQPAARQPLPQGA